MRHHGPEEGNVAEKDDVVDFACAVPLELSTRYPASLMFEVSEETRNDFLRVDIL